MVASRVRLWAKERWSERRGVSGDAFGTKEQRRAALVRLIGPDGLSRTTAADSSGASACIGVCYQRATGAEIAHGGHDLPRDQGSADTWFAAIHLVVTAKNGIWNSAAVSGSSSRRPGPHKIMAVMARREGESTPISKLQPECAPAASGAAARRARRPSWRRSRPVPRGARASMKLAPVKGFRKREIARGAKHWLRQPGAAVVTDGLGCWSALDEARLHQAPPHRVGPTGGPHHRSNG